MTASAACTRRNPAFATDEGTTGGGIRPPRTETTDGASTSSDPPRTSSSEDTIDPDPESSDEGSEETSDEPERCVPIGEPCDPFDPAACIDAACRPWGDPDDPQGIACIEPQPSLTQLLLAGAPCEHTCDGELGQDDCEPGTICDPFSPEPKCVHLCVDEGQQQPLCPGGDPCELYEAGGESFGLCRSGCDPLAPDDCPLGQMCVLMGDSGGCIPAGDGVEGDGCLVVNDCGSGLACLPDVDIDCGSNAGCCTPLCDPGAGIETCEQGFQCNALSGDVGACYPS